MQAVSMRAVVMHASGAGRNSILNSLSCRVTRRGAANGAQEFNGILKLHTAAEERTAIYQGWVSACRKGHTKAEESGDSKKAREYVEAEQSVLQQIAAELGASASEKFAKGQQSSQEASRQPTIGSGVPESSGIAASKEVARPTHSKRPHENTVEDATVHSCAVVTPDKRARSEQPMTGSRVTRATVEPSQGLATNQATKIADSTVTATPASADPVPAESADRSMLVAPPSLAPPSLQPVHSHQPAHNMMHATVAPVTKLPGEHHETTAHKRQQHIGGASVVTGTHEEYSQVSIRSAGVRDTQNSAQSASAHADRHPTGGPPSAVHATATDSAIMARGDMQREVHGEPIPTPSTRSMPKTTPALPPIPSSSLGHTKHGSTISGDGNMRASSAREDGTERSAGMQTARQGKTTRVPLQERPRAEAAAVRQQKVVTFQEPQSSRDVADSSQRQQQLQPVQRASPASSRVTVKQEPGSEGMPKESSFSGWDIADPNLCRPKKYRPVKNPREGDILFVREAPFKIMYRVGSGASSKVYKVLGPNLRLFALKVVTLKGCNSKEMVNGFKQEFDKLKSLKDSPGVINVHSLEEFPEDKMLLMCMEIGDIDLSNLLKKKRLEWEARGITDPFVADPTFICGLWHDMLRAVQSIHQHKIVHADLKPANLVIVNGSIKIIDFGISMQCGANTTSIQREDNTGTVNYMSPEAISNRERVGRNSDVWSLGCILYEIAYGRLPFGHIRNLASKVEAIMNSKVEFPDISQGDVLHVLKRCLVRNPDKRADIDELLNHQYLKTVSGGVITHQTMWNMMMASYRRHGFNEDEVNELCRQLQEGWNKGQNFSAEAIFAKALDDKKAANLPVSGPAAQPSQEHVVLQQQQPNRMPSSHADVQQPKDVSAAKSAVRQPAAKPQHSAENAGDVLDARLMAIRRAHEEADDGNTKHRL